MIPALTTPLAGLAVTALLAYLLGAVPFGIVMARLFGLGDLRRIGSGNIGATNVLRTGNRLAAFLTLVLDAGKGAIAVLAARAAFGPDAAQIAGFAAFLGHCFPVYLRLKGGKGVATFLGTLWALWWPLYSHTTPVLLPSVCTACLLLLVFEPGSGSSTTSTPGTYVLAICCATL